MTRSELVLWFVGGCLLEVVLLLRPVLSRPSVAGVRLAASLFGALFGAFMAGDASGGDPHVAAFGAVLGFAFAFALAFLREVFPEVTEATLLVLTLIFWYAFAALPLSPGWKLALASVAFVPTIGSLWMAFTDHTVGAWERAFFYCWYLTVICTLLWFQFAFDHLAFFFEPNAGQHLTRTTLVLSGMSFFYLCIHAAHFVALIPIPGKRQSFADRFADIRIHLGALGEKVGYDELELRRAIAISSGLAAALLANHVTEHFSHHTVVALALTVTVPLTTGQLNRAGGQ